MQSNHAHCLVCKEGPAEIDGSGFRPDLVIGNCARCGRYELNRDFQIQVARHADDIDRALLSAYSRQLTDAGTVAKLTGANWRGVVEQMRSVPVEQKVLRTLRALADTTRVAGDPLYIDSHSELKARLQRQAGAANQVELEFMLSALVERGHLAVDLDQLQFGQAGWGVAGMSAVVTVEGWSVLQRESAIVRGTCFVAMWFNPELDLVFESAIKAATVACGLQVIRVDRVEHNDNINDRIMADIRRSEVLIADFTGHRGGVYFEAGFALGLDRTVVFTCREEDFSHAHFDTRPYNHILWRRDALPEFRENLEARLRNTVPSLKAPLGLPTGHV